MKSLKDITYRDFWQAHVEIGYWSSRGDSYWERDESMGVGSEEFVQTRIRELLDDDKGFALALALTAMGYDCA